MSLINNTACNNNILPASPRFSLGTKKVYVHVFTWMFTFSGIPMTMSEFTECSIHICIFDICHQLLTSLSKEYCRNRSTVHSSSCSRPGPFQAHSCGKDSPRIRLVPAFSWTKSGRNYRDLVGNSSTWYHLRDREDESKVRNNTFYFTFLSSWIYGSRFFIRIWIRRQGSTFSRPKYAGVACGPARKRVPIELTVL